MPLGLEMFHLHDLGSGDRVDCEIHRHHIAEYGISGGISPVLGWR
jgi:hypothetical protein